MFPNTSRNYAHEVVNLRDVIYQITEEIAYHMYCCQNAQLFLSSDRLSQIIDTLSKQEPLLKTVQQRVIATRCYALCNYWKSSSDDGIIEFYHNNIRDFFVCEKVYTAMKKAYENWKIDSKSGLYNAVKFMYSLFSYSKFNSVVCQFIYQRSSNMIKYGTKDFPSKDSLAQFIPELFESILIAAQNLKAVSGATILKRISNTLTCVAQFYRHYCEPYLQDSSSIKWWSSVDKVNSDGLLKYLFTTTFSCELAGTETEPRSMISSWGDFSNLNLTTVNMMNLGLQHSNFLQAKLSSAILVNCDCSSAHFENADLSNTVANRAKFTNAKMHNCCLINSYLTCADVTAANFSNADLCEADLSYTFVCDTATDKVIFVNAKMKGCNLSGAKLRGANLKGAILTQANLTSASLVKVDLTGADMMGADLTGADMMGADLTGTNLTDTNLTGVNLSNANLSNLDLTQIIIRYYDKNKLKFNNARMRSTNLSGLNLKRVDFMKADLTNADLRYTNLFGVDLRKASLSGAVLPDGFSSTDQKKQVEHLKELNIGELRI